MNTAMREIGKMKKKKQKKHDHGRFSEQFVRVTDKNMLIVGQSRGMNY